MKKHRNKNRSKNRNTFAVNIERHSLIFGLLGDLFRLSRMLSIVIGYPIKLVSKGIAAFFKQFPSLKVLHSHTLISVGVGMAVLAISFSIGELYNNALWHAFVESLRAVGACPIWENVSVKLVQAEI